MARGSLVRSPAHLLAPPIPPPPILLFPSFQYGTHQGSAVRLLFPGEGRRGRCSRPLLALPGEHRVAPEEVNGEENWTWDGWENEEEGERAYEKNYLNPCELYVCNLPGSFEVGDLARLFGPFGNVTAVLVSRNPSTGKSRGAAYVTMGSFIGAEKAVAALEGSVVSGREIRVRYAADMKHDTSKIEEGRWWELQPKTVTNQIYEGKYKLYVGNLELSLRPEDIREFFSQFGTVVSAMLVKDCRRGKQRSYAFVTYASEKELEAALSVNGKVIAGRVISVRWLKDDWIKGGPSRAY